MKVEESPKSASLMWPLVAISTLDGCVPGGGGSREAAAAAAAARLNGVLLNEARDS